MAVGKKIRQIREAEGMSRAAFSEATGIPKDTLMRIEQGRNEPRASVLTIVCEHWPKYAYWLMTGHTDPPNGHVSPELEQTRKDWPGAEKAS